MWRTSAGGRGGRCMHEADERMGPDEADRRTSGRANRGGKGVDSRADGRTGPMRRGHADGRKRRGWRREGADEA